MGSALSKIWKKLFQDNEMRFLMVGVDAAGKTTILYKLKLGEVVWTTPTVGFNVEQVKYRNISFTSLDIGGGEDMIKSLFLRQHFESFQGLIFVVDSNDRDRIDYAGEYFQRMVNQDQFSEVVILVFANKQDLPGALTCDQVADKLGLNTLRNRNWFIQGSCAISGDGLTEGLDWLSKAISVKKS